MDIGHVVAVGFGNDLIGESDDRRIVLINAVGDAIGRLFGFGVLNQLAEGVSKRPGVRFSNERLEKPLDITPQAHGIPYRQAGKGVPDVVTPLEIMGVVDQDIQNLAIAFEGQPAAFPKVIVTEISHEFWISDGPFVIWNIRTVEIPAQRLAERRFGDTVFLDQHAFQVCAFVQGILNRLHEISLANEPFVDQEIESTRVDRRLSRPQHW